MRALRISAVAALVLLVAAWFACDDVIESALRAQWDWADDSLLEDGELHVVLCGTGLPIPSADRLPACTAVLADGEFMLIDAGAGTPRQADLLALPVRRLSTILVTHFHSDHIGGLGQALAHSWFRGREGPVRVYGPPGIERVMRGFVEAYTFDTQHRTLPLADELDPRWQLPEVHEISVDGDRDVIVFEREGLLVRAFAVDHSPIAPAYGYRIDWRGRSVVVSGDTRAHPPLAGHAQGADLLIHSAGAAVPEFLVEPILRLQERRELPRVDLTLFSSPVQVAELAQRARARKLVFAHILPISNPFLRWFWLRGVGDVYDGEVVVGEDGMRFDLEPEER